MTTTTTKTGPAPRIGGTRPLLVAAAAVVVLVGLLTIAAAVTSGATAAYAALVGGLIAAGVLLAGTVVVNAAAAVAPTVSLLVALLTYVLQVVVLALLVAALADTSIGADDTARGWLAAAVIAATLVWLVVQIRIASRLRIPAYDLPDKTVPTPASGARPRGEDGDQR